MDGKETCSVFAMGAYRFQLAACMIAVKQNIDSTHQRSELAAKSPPF